jgi:hypothetical protein
MRNGYRSLKDIGLTSVILVLLCRALESKISPRIALCPLRPGLGLGTCLGHRPRAVGEKEVELVKMDMSMT